jgi:hypothetical protein
MGYFSPLRMFRCLRFLAFLILVLSVSADAQNFQQLPSYSSPTLSSPTNVPSNPLGLPGSSYAGPRGEDNVSLSSGLFRDLFPKIPNLEFGFNYMFGSNLRQSRWSIDYLLPMGFGPDATLFAEAHGESVISKSSTWVPFLNNFWQLTAPGDQSRLDLSFGIGYRRIFAQDLLLGVNAFYDTTRLYGPSWRSSGGYGLEMAANGPGDSAIDLTFNYYGNVYGGYNSRGSVFPTFNIIDGIQNGTANYDLEAGYSQSIIDQTFDLRFKVTGYQFALNNSKKYGIKSGAELTTADGVFRCSVEGGQDGVSGTYGNVSGYVNVGFQLEKLLYGENPFGMPEPVFKSPRNLRRLLARPVHRLWVKPATVVANSNCEGLPDDSLFAHPRDKSCFYVGYKQETYQACRNAGYLIMADTVGQQTFSNPYITPYERPPYNYERDVDPMWDCSSAAYSRAASGEVHAYMYSARLYDYSSTFFRVELPVLQANPNVTNVWVYSGTGSDPTTYIPVGDWKHGIN